MEVRGSLHGGSWRSPWRSVEVSMEVRGGSMELREGLLGGSWSSMELRGGLHGVPNNVGRRPGDKQVKTVEIVVVQ